MRKDWLRVLREIADEVYLTIKPLLGTEMSKKTVGIGASGDITRAIDALAEEVIIHHLERRRISCFFVGEESGTLKIGEEPETYMVVDSIDGTTNAIRGINFASTSIAVSSKDSLKDIEAALVMRLDNGGVYAAEKRSGSVYDGRKIRPSRARSIEDAIVSIDISRSPETIGRVLPLMKAVSHIRSLGSAALEICHVASGHLDAYVDARGKLRTTDIAAALLILKEAGGIVLKPNGEELDDAPLTKMTRFSLIAAANAEIVHEIIQRLENG